MLWQSASIRRLGSAPSISSLHSWNDFFTVRSKLKRIGMACGVPSAFLLLVCETILLSQPLFDPTMTIFGTDPMLMIILGTFGGTVTSFVAGSMTGKYLYSSRYPNLRVFMDQVSKSSSTHLFPNLPLLLCNL